MKKLFKIIFGHCWRCNKWLVYPKKYRTKTAYVNDADNYEVGCKACQKESDEYWAERWADLY